MSVLIAEIALQTFKRNLDLTVSVIFRFVYLRQTLLFLYHCSDSTKAALPNNLPELEVNQ